MKLVYPACFYPFSDADGYTVVVPDLPGCVTEGSSLADAIAMGVDAASGWVLDEMEDGKLPPKASDISAIKPDEGGFVSLLVLGMDSYAEKYGAKAVRKNVTVPAYLNRLAEEKHLSLSKVLREALEKTAERLSVCLILLFTNCCLIKCQVIQKEPPGMTLSGIKKAAADDVRTLRAKQMYCPPSPSG